MTRIEAASINLYKLWEFTIFFLLSQTGLAEKLVETSDDYKLEIRWRNVFIFLYLHLAAMYSLTLTKKPTSVAIGWIWGILAGYGVTVGAHRLFAHRSYKANLPMRIMCMILQTMTMENDIIEWARDHRVHHKFTDTNADPHNSTRGFFFSHIGWLMCKKHPDVRKFGAKVDMSDLENDPVCRFQRKFVVSINMRWMKFSSIFCSP